LLLIQEILVVDEQLKKNIFHQHHPDQLMAADKYKMNEVVEEDAEEDVYEQFEEFTVNQIYEIHGLQD
jgi:hypothetical protein